MHISGVNVHTSVCLCIWRVYRWRNGKEDGRDENEHNYFVL